MMPRSAMAQTRFQWASSVFDVSEYQYAEKCLAMLKRVNDSIENRTDLHPFARHWKDFGRYHNYYEPVQRTVAKCHGDKTFSNWKLSGLLYRIAGMEDKFDQVVRDDLATIPKDSALQLVNVLDAALWYFLTQRPIKLAETHLLINQYLQFKHLLPKERIAYTLGLLLDVADESNDSLMLQRLLIESQELLGSLNIDTVESNIQGFYGKLAITVYEVQNRDSLINALTESVPAYNKRWSQYLRRKYPFFKRKDYAENDSRMDQLYAKFWYPSGIDLGEYPRIGRVTLMVNLPSGSYYAYDPHRAVLVAQVRRLKAKFPDVDILLNYQTRGFFGVVEPPTPVQEAALVDSLWLQFHKLPAILLVEETPFWRLPPFDRRRVNEKTAYDNFGDQEALGEVGMAYRYLIIDQNRDILQVSESIASESSFRTEKEIEWKIEALLRRKRQ